MVVDFAKVNVKEQPLLILQNMDDTPIGVLGYAFNVEADLCYNEISTLSFDLPGYVDGKATPNYEKVVGMRIIDLKDYGRFLLVDPKTNSDGVREVKTCTAYSLEYEFTFKKLVLTAGTYNLWNPIAPKGTIIGMILDLMPSWKIGQVDASLIDKYRTFDDSGDQNIYNFMKSDLQESYGCVFDFDTYNRLIYVRDIENEPETTPVLFSLSNLIKEVSVEEDTESIVTQLSVYGADNVDIRSVNPMGTTSLINLDYFMTHDYFSQDIIDKYNNWKETFQSYQRTYFNYTVEEALKTAQLITEQAAITTLEGELKSLENIQATTIQAIAQGLKSQSDLNKVNQDISVKKGEISAKQSSLADIQAEVDELDEKMQAINEITKLSAFFTENEYKVIDRYLKEDSISEDSFVAIEVDSFDSAGESIPASGSIFNITDATVTKVVNETGKDIYSIVGGHIGCSTSGFVLDAEIIRASLDFDDDHDLLFTARLSAGSLNGESFPSGCVSVAGTGSTVTSNVVPDSSVGGAIEEGSSVSFKIGTADLYFTRSTTEYEKRAVEWDLLDYGMELMERVSYPSYTCTLDLANFLAMSEFEPFKKSLKLGSRLYWQRSNGEVMRPYLVSVRIPFEDLTGFEVELSSKYYANGDGFNFTDLIEESNTAGKTLDSGKWTYSQFVNSGAETSLSKFTKEALDIAKNNILSSTGQDISWSESGLRLRKRKEDSPTEYDPYEIWMNNGQIMFTTDNWETANLAIGQIKTEDGGIMSGVIADSLIGKLLAGSSMIIESAKKDGGQSVFRVDGNGASLHNAIFDIYNGNQVQITMNPYSGFAIGKYPLYSDDKYTINEDNANFWVDIDGNVHIKGTLEGCDGTFSGELVAASGRFKGVVQASDYQDLSGRSMLTSSYKFSPTYLELRGLTINNGSKNTLVIDSAGNITMDGNITLSSGSKINWNTVTQLGTNPQISNLESDMDTRLNRINTQLDYVYEDIDWLSENMWTEKEIRNISSTVITDELVSSPMIKGAYIQGGTIQGCDFLFGDYGVIYDGYGSDGVNRTNLVYIESTQGIAIVANKGMALRAGDGIWIPNDIHIMVNGGYVDLGSVIEDLLAK